MISMICVFFFVAHFVKLLETHYVHSPLRCELSWLAYHFELSALPPHISLQHHEVSVEIQATKTRPHDIQQLVECMMQTHPRPTTGNHHCDSKVGNQSDRIRWSSGAYIYASYHMCTVFHSIYICIYIQRIIERYTCTNIMYKWFLIKHYSSVFPRVSLYPIEVPPLL